MELKRAESDEKQFSAISLELKKFEAKAGETGNFGYFSGYGAAFNNIDSYNDIILPGAFAKTLMKNSKFVLAWQHDMDKPVGSIMSAEEDGYGLKIEGRINLDTTLGKDAYALLKAGDIDSMSIGYWVKDFQYDTETDIRRIEEIELAEISLVSMPANRNAKISDVKALQRIDSAKSLADIESLLRDKGFTKNEAVAIVSKAKKFGGNSGEPKDDKAGQSESDNVKETFVDALKKLTQHIGDSNV